MPFRAILEPDCRPLVREGYLGGRLAGVFGANVFSFVNNAAAQQGCP